MRRFSKYLVGLLLAGALLWWVLRGTDPTRVASELLDASPVQLLLCFALKGVAVPTPVGAGSYHAAVKSGLMLYGVSRTTAVGAGFLLHELITIPVIACGMVLLWTERISWRELVRSADRMRRPGGAERTVENAS